MPKRIRKDVSPARERRLLSDGELRIKADGDKRKIVGYAAKFNVLSSDLGGFREQLAPHAFDACLASNPDVAGLFNHDANLVLGRTTAGTMRLSVDAVGLKYEIDPPDTSFARDLLVSMQRRDVHSSSFGFICNNDTWKEDANGQIIRTVLDATLFDCSPVTFPAYPDATSGVRASLRSAPAAIRAKLKRDEDDEDEEDDPAHPDPDYDNEDDEDDEGDDCRCVCRGCRDGYCALCSDESCDEENCRGCTMQTRAAHLKLLALRAR